MFAITLNVIFFLTPFIFGFSRLKEPVDLTWPFDNNTIYWKNATNFTIINNIKGYDSNGVWFTIEDFCAGEHGGTHLDAPYHFYEFGQKVGDIPLSKLIVNGITINLKNEAAELKDKALLLPQHLIRWERRNGRIPRNTVVLVQFGWAQFYNNITKYLGLDQTGNYRFPGISGEAAQWIVNNGNVVGVGIDTASMDSGDNTTVTHQIITKNGLYGLENIRIPNNFPEKGFMLLIMPMKIRDGTGAPTKIIAVPHTQFC